MMEVMKIMVTSFKMFHDAQLQAVYQSCSRPAPTHASTRDTWTLIYMSGSVSFGVTAPFFLSWCSQGAFFFFLCVYVCPPRICFSALCKFGSSIVGLMATSSKRVYAIPKFAASRAPVSVAVHCWPVPIQESLQHSLSQSLWGAWVLVHTRFVWRESGLILNVNSPLLLSCLGLSFALGHGVSPHSHSSAT